MDILLSVVGFMMTFSVFENVLTEFINEQISGIIARELDAYARRAFPLCFFTNLAILISCTGPNNFLGVTAPELFNITHGIL